MVDMKWSFQFFAKYDYRFLSDVIIATFFRKLFRLSDYRENCGSCNKSYFILDKKGDEERERGEIEGRDGEKETEGKGKGQKIKYTEGEREEETKRGGIEKEERVEGNRGEKEGRDREERHMIIDRGKERSGKRQGGRDRGTETEKEREW
jgi:hypothetical protein